MVIAQTPAAKGICRFGRCLCLHIGIRTYLYTPVLFHRWTTTLLGLPDLYEDSSLVAVAKEVIQLVNWMVYACALGG